jgi:prophage regulatory protein
MTLTSSTAQTEKRKRSRPPLTAEQRASRNALPTLPPKPRNRRADHVTRPEVLAYADKPLSDRPLSRFEVLARCNMSTSALYRYMSDGRFPKPDKLSPRKVQWRPRDIAAWLADPVNYRANDNDAPVVTAA